MKMQYCNRMEDWCENVNQKDYILISCDVKCSNCQECEELDEGTKIPEDDDYNEEDVHECQYSCSCSECNDSDFCPYR